MFVRRNGSISMDIVTGKYLLVIRGPTARVHAQPWGLIFPVSTVKKKMFMFKVYMMGSILGSELKGNLYGAMEHRTTSITGRNTSQTTFTMRTVFIRLVSFKIIDTNGTMLIAVTVTDSLVRKVRHNFRAKLNLATVMKN